MKELETKSQNKFGNWLKTSITARMLMVGFLTIVLLIPLVFIENLITERKNRQENVINEINEKWGNEVILYGPILKVPYKVFRDKTVTDNATKQVYTETIEQIDYAYFFPKALDINSNINPEPKKRGIYSTAVYKSNMTLNGSFQKPEFKDEEINPENILWDRAKIMIRTSNIKGVSKAILKVNSTQYNLQAKFKNTQFNNKLSTFYTLESNNLNKTDLKFENNLTFNLTLNVKGSQEISFIPIGKTTEAQITSNWKTANFYGEFLPYNGDKVSENGFDAKWKILDINRPFSQENFKYLPDLQEFAFGVNFMIPVDEYLQSERSAKYGFLVIALTFLIFFLIQTMSKINIHPFQYLMIGLALTMFYTLLISISEHSSFSKAYVIAGVSVVALITLYSKTIMRHFKFPLLIGFSLTALYTFIYVIIQLENYALLVGSIGLFLILATVMFVSRKINWSND